MTLCPDTVTQVPGHAETAGWRTKRVDGPSDPPPGEDSHDYARELPRGPSRGVMLAAPALRFDSVHRGPKRARTASRAAPLARPLQVGSWTRSYGFPVWRMWGCAPGPPPHDAPGVTHVPGQKCYPGAGLHRPTVSRVERREPRILLPRTRQSLPCNPAFSRPARSSRHHMTLFWVGAMRRSSSTDRLDLPPHGSRQLRGGAASSPRPPSRTLE